MHHPPELAPDFVAARDLLRKHGKSYYFASQFFSHDLRLSTYALYAFVRVPDEIVDNSPLETEADLCKVKSQLDGWHRRWLQAYRDGDSSDPILRVATYVFHEHKIPFEHSEAFLAAMKMDLEKATYENYRELEQYMYGSAAVIGLMMTHIVGFKQPQALEHAQQLGYAMQLTNFLRDIEEDWTQRQRIYMPQDELARFGLSSRDIVERRFSPAFRDFVRFQSERASALYIESNKGIPMLKPGGRRSVAVASALYRAILSKIEAQDWNIFAGRAHTRFYEKLWILSGVLRGNYA